MTSILITGINGFVGSHVAKKLGMSKNFIIGVGRRYHTKYHQDLYENVNLMIDINLTTHRAREILTQLIIDHDVDVVFHFAAQSLVTKAQRNPFVVMKDNYLMTATVVEACRQARSNLVYMSTDKVYGNQEDVNVPDMARYEVTDFYAASKIASEIIPIAYKKNKNFPVLILRTCNLYGADLFSYRLVPNTIKKLINNERPLIHAGMKTAKRQFMYIDDFTAMMEIIIKKHDVFFDDIKKGNTWFIHNVCPPPRESTYTVIDVVREVITSFNRVGKYHGIDDAIPFFSENDYIELPSGVPTEIKHQSMHPTLSHVLGFNEFTSIKQGLEETILQFINYKDDWMKKMHVKEE